jgi:hypothetical protein
MLGVSVIFVTLGLYQLLAAGRVWMGAILCAFGLFWLAVGWHYRRQ